MKHIKYWDVQMIQHIQLVAKDQFWMLFLVVGYTITGWWVTENLPDVQEYHELWKVNWRIKEEEDGRQLKRSN